MWDNPRLLNLIAGALVGVAALAFAFTGAWMLMHSDMFPVRHVVVVTPVAKTSKVEIHAAAQSRITGNFFAVSPAEVRGALEKLPWVRAASVRRVWPDRLEVTLEEHVALARWGDEGEAGALVSARGERFTASAAAERLPLFIAPAGAEREVARRYARFAAIVAPLAPIERVVLTQRYAWQLRLENGQHLMLGRDADAAEARLARFVQVVEAGAAAARSAGYVDLRYPNGFAVRVSEGKG